MLRCSLLEGFNAAESNLELNYRLLLLLRAWQAIACTQGAPVNSGGFGTPCSGGRWLGDCIGSSRPPGAVVAAPGSRPGGLAGASDGVDVPPPPPPPPPPPRPPIGSEPASASSSSPSLTTPICLKEPPCPLLLVSCGTPTIHRTQTDQTVDSFIEGARSFESFIGGSACMFCSRTPFNMPETPEWGTDIGCRWQHFLTSSRKAS